MGQVQRRARLKRELQGKARVKVLRVAGGFTVMSVRLELAGEALARLALVLGGALRAGLEAAVKKVLDETSLS